MNGHGVPFTGRFPLCPLMELPEEIFTQGAGDHREPKSLKSPSRPCIEVPSCATAPATDGAMKSK